MNTGMRLRSRYYQRLGLPVDSADSSAGISRPVAARCESPVSPRQKYMFSLFRNNILTFSLARPKPYQTLLILDWDDTLLCTSYLHPGGKTVSHPRLTDLDYQRFAAEFLRELETAVSALLTLALRHGPVCIITNADPGWVEWSASNYMPGLTALMRRVRVVSARGRYMSKFPDDAARWKLQAFLDARHALQDGIVTNIVAVGDSCLEMAAACYVGTKCAGVIMKTVKFMERPLPRELIKEINLLSGKLDFIVNSPKNLMIKLDKK